jgi:hypothetical protein
MNREVHVRFWEGVGVKSSRATQLIKSPRSPAGVLLVQIDFGILQTMRGTTCANMSFFRAAVCHRLESNA